MKAETKQETEYEAAQRNAIQPKKSETVNKSVSVPYFFAPALGKKRKLDQRAPGWTSEDCMPATVGKRCWHIADVATSTIAGREGSSGLGVIYLSG